LLILLSEGNPFFGGFADHFTYGYGRGRSNFQRRGHSNWSKTALPNF